MMNTLQEFAAPNVNEITLCEVNGQVHSMNYETANIITFTKTTERCPKIHITREMIHPSKFMEDVNTTFVQRDISFLKQISQIYYEQGIVEALDTVSASKLVGFSQLAQVLLLALDKFQKCKIFLNPSLTKTSTALIAQYCQTRNWNNTPVRCIALHPNAPRIAVAAFDDTIRVYSSLTSLIPILKCRQQKNITAMAWRSGSLSDLAVGCEKYIIVWTVDPRSAVTKVSSNTAAIVQRFTHYPILSISWNPLGNMLATVAGADSKILIWNIEMNMCSALRRRGTSGNILTKWSPNGEKLFTATTAHLFRVWDCTTWEPERWSVLTGHVQAACWSPCSKNLLFATSVEPVIYTLSFAKRDKLFTTDVDATPNQAVPLYDVTKIEINGVLVGGLIQSMEWSPQGQHIAVLFSESNYIAIFNVIMETHLTLTPGFLIAGNSQEIPTSMAFDPTFDSGACLCIAWSSGRIQYFPIVYSVYNEAT